MLAVVVWPAAKELRRDAFLRFSRLATVCIAAILVAGVYLSILRLPHVSDLWTQGYGQVLLVKLSLVAVALAWGAVHHFVARPALERGQDGMLQRLPRSLIGESLVGISILLLAAVLVNSKPPPQPREGTGAGGSGRALRPARGPIPNPHPPTGVVTVAGGSARSVTGLCRFAAPWSLRRRFLRQLAYARCCTRSPAARASSACTSRGGCSPTATTSARSTSLPLDDAELERSVEELRGDVRDLDAVRRLVDGADVVVHSAAALPIQASRAQIRSVNVGGTENVLVAAKEAGVGRALLISSTAVYGVPEKHPIEETDPLVGVGHYGESKIDAEALFRVAAVESTIIRPKTFIGPERLGVFEILFDWIREGRRIPILGDGSNRYQLLAVEDLVDAIVRASTAPGGRRGDLQRRREGVRHRPLRPPGADRPRRLGRAAAARSAQARRGRPARARARAPLAARGVALQDRVPGLVRGRVQGGAAARLEPAPLERAGADRDLRLVPRAPRHAGRRRRHAPRAVEPAGARASSRRSADARAHAQPGRGAARPRRARRRRRRGPGRPLGRARLDAAADRGARARAGGPARRDARLPPVGGARVQARVALPAQPRPPHPSGGDHGLRPGERHARSR